MPGHRFDMTTDTPDATRITGSLVALAIASHGQALCARALLLAPLGAAPTPQTVTPTDSRQPVPAADRTARLDQLTARPLMAPPGRRHTPAAVSSGW